MTLIKHGVGEILPEEEAEQKTASKNWTEEDSVELLQENAEK